MKWCGDKLQAYRKEAGLTQKELGIAVGKIQQLIAKYETNLITPPFHIISAMADVLDISEAQLLDIEMEEGSYRAGFKAGVAFVIDKINKDVDKAISGRR